MDELGCYMAAAPDVVHSHALPEGQSGELLNFSRESVQWEWMSMSARRLNPGETYSARTQAEEAAFVLLGGRCTADWGDGAHSIGQRKNVFDGLPYSVYLPAGHSITFKAETVCEIAECRVPSEAKLQPKLITPKEVFPSLRGGENASRQIVDILRPDFPADKLVVIEVYTPGGNWSSFPPHKHDVHNPPAEVDLDEIYFYKISRPEGYAIQRVYTRDGWRDETLTVRDNEVVLIPEGYHPVVAAHGYDCYYLNVLAGSARSMAATDDPDYAWVRSSWRNKDPRLPLVH